MISKTEIGGGKELPGCEMELYDEENNLIHSWTSSDVAESLKNSWNRERPIDWLKKARHLDIPMRKMLPLP